MTNSLRNTLIVIVVVFGTVMVSAQSLDPSAAIVQAIDRNTRAQIRTCEAIHLQNQGEGYQTWHQARPPHPHQIERARRCWQ